MAKYQQQFESWRNKKKSCSQFCFLVFYYFLTFFPFKQKGTMFQMRGNKKKDSRYVKENFVA
jgi:hypothetical protein